MQDQRTRRCPNCNRTLELDQFRKRKYDKTEAERKRLGQPDGWCRACRRTHDLKRRTSIEGYISNCVMNVRSRSRRAGITCDLSVERIMKIYQDQDGKCAITSVPMTAVIGHGPMYTNLSVDRIETGGPYTVANTRLVCYVVNIMRHTMSDDELRYWAKKISKGLGRPKPA